MMPEYFSYKSEPHLLLVIRNGCTGRELYCKGWFSDITIAHQIH